MASGINLTDDRDDDPMAPLPGSQYWLESGPGVVHDNLDEAVLVVRLGLALNALRAQQRFTVSNSSAEPGAAKMRDGVWAFLTAAAYTGEAINILTGTGGVPGAYGEIVRLAKI
jgi:hypothetical protein